ncbi:MAG: hypothetical protein QF440_05275 [Candidatus Thalassarchaeaceae archaeon]|nr:hypothetical protein [Candidatus Thalassarchaeaceae archaeon]
MNTRRLSAFVMLFVLLVPLGLPTAVAWQEDGWLTQEVVGGERLELGDEFGCHGIPGVNTLDNLKEVVGECKEYLTDRIDASKWGSNPLSFGLPSEEISDAHGLELFESGFRVVGDQIEGDPNYVNKVERNGGSLEKNVADEDLIQSVASHGGLVSMYWEARIEDLNVRRDKDVVEWIEDQSVWYTTWGEYHSYLNGGELNTTDSDGNLEISISSGLGYWPVPLTLRIDLGNVSIQKIIDENGMELELMGSEEGHLRSGWRVENSYLIISVSPDLVTTIYTEGETDWSDVTIIENQPLFNNHTWAIAVAGHHTTDLFEWSEPFQYSSLRFTWLVEPKADIEPSWILPMVAIVIILVAPTAIWWTLKKDREMQNYSDDEE